MVASIKMLGPIRNRTAGPASSVFVGGLPWQAQRTKVWHGL